MQVYSCLTQDEAKAGFGFSRKMRLNLGCVAAWKGYESIHGYHTNTNFKTDGRFCQWG